MASNHPPLHGLQESVQSSPRPSRAIPTPSALADEATFLWPLLTRLYSCGRLLRAAQGRQRLMLSAAASVRAEQVQASLDPACDALGVPRLGVVHGEHLRLSAVERVVTRRLAVDEWVEAPLPAAERLEALIRVASAHVVAADPLNRFAVHPLQSRLGLPLRAYEIGSAAHPGCVVAMPVGVPVETCVELCQLLGSRYHVVVVEGSELVADADDFAGVRFAPNVGATDLLAVADHFALDRFHLVGMCASAMPTLQFAAEHTARLRSLVLGNGAFATTAAPKSRFELDFLRLMSFVGGRRDRAGQALGFLLSQDLDQVEPECAHYTMLPYANPDAFYMFATCYRDLYAAELNERELGMWLDAIRVPTLMLVSEQDNMTHPEASHIIASKLADCQLVSEREGTHLSLLRACSGTLTERILAFCAQVDAAYDDDKAGAPAHEGA